MKSIWKVFEKFSSFLQWFLDLSILLHACILFENLLKQKFMLPFAFVVVVAVEVVVNKKLIQFVWWFIWNILYCKIITV